MCKHHIKYEEKCTHVTQFQGQMYTIYLQAYMMCSCEINDWTFHVWVLCKEMNCMIRTFTNIK